MLKNRLMNLCAAIFLLFMMGSTLVDRADAHRVMVFAYLEGEKVHVEGYFADGKKARDSLVEVFAKDGAKVLEGRTDENGLFTFPAPALPAIRIVLTASMGHRVECILDGAGDTLVPGGIKKETSGAALPPAEGAVIEDRIRAIVSEELDRKLAPLAREVALLRERRTSLADIIGGIGYIVGLAGLFMYFKVRGKEG